jgi:alpha-L-fucosidase
MTLLAGGKTLETEKTADGLVIHVPATAPDALATVIKVELK